MTEPKTIDELRAALAARFPGRTVLASRNLWQYGAPNHAVLGEQAEDYRVHVLRQSEKTDDGVAVESCKTPADAFERIIALHAKMCAKAPCSACSGTGKAHP